ncbi:MAG: hypothetical protein V1819_02190 [bacterium]
MRTKKRNTRLTKKDDKKRKIKIKGWTKKRSRTQRKDDKERKARGERRRKPKKEAFEMVLMAKGLPKSLVERTKWLNDLYTVFKSLDKSKEVLEAIEEGDQVISSGTEKELIELKGRFAVESFKLSIDIRKATK